jgi:hypothetical protein
VVSVFEYTKNAATGQYTLYKRCGRSDVEVNGSSGVGVGETGPASADLLVLRGTALELVSAAATARVVELVDGQGRVVLSRTIAPGRPIDLSGLAAGVYTARSVERDAVLAAQRIALR